LKTEQLDIILYWLFLLARLGENSNFRWWNVDVCDKDSAIDIFRRIHREDSENGEAKARIIAGETIFQAAKHVELKELSVLKLSTDNDRCLSIFNPRAKDGFELLFRIRHFKTYPNEFKTSKLFTILDSKLSKSELINLWKEEKKKFPSVKVNTTNAVKIANKAPDDLILYYQNLLSAFPELEEGKFIPVYYEN